MRFTSHSTVGVIWPNSNADPSLYNNSFLLSQTDNQNCLFYCTGNYIHHCCHALSLSYTRHSLIKTTIHYTAKVSGYKNLVNFSNSDALTEIKPWKFTLHLGRCVWHHQIIVPLHRLNRERPQRTSSTAKHRTRNFFADRSTLTVTIVC